LCIWVTDEEGRRTKTGLERVVPVSDKLLPALERRLESTRGGELFPFAVDDSGASFGRLWLKKVKNIDATLTMHGFRAYATSQMENAGVNPGVARLILGHEQADVHEGYFHKQIGTLKEAVDKIH
ncbi:MAG: tyrosine-type recombinase/integrase, partial [bacterium]